jgi:hypothetical protein
MHFAAADSFSLACNVFNTILNYRIHPMVDHLQALTVWQRLAGAGRIIGLTILNRFSAVQRIFQIYFLIKRVL